ncbi:MAG: aldolase [Nanoarchaeota archaeon]|nr:aldolase [Nanoarchaeota archaeon]
MKITEADVVVPASVPNEQRETYIKNYLLATRNTGRLMLFAGDQKAEHLNDDFAGEADIGKIPDDDGDPEHLFRIAHQAEIGVFATQFGLIARYGPSYRDIPYLVKMNSKTHLDKGTERDPRSLALASFDDVLRLQKNGLAVLGIGCTVYPGSEHEAEMLAQAGQLFAKAHEHGMIAVLWSYPRGRGVKNDKDPHLVAGAAGIGAVLGADFVKVKQPKQGDVSDPALLKEAIRAAGRTKIVCEGGSSTKIDTFLRRLYDQIHVAGVSGNATGRNIHQKSLTDAVRMANAISAITVGDKDVAFALQVAEGKQSFRVV